ncbi:MAG: hypothetical protein LBK06_09915, partial [Planctomycetaceae bacterium]|nr:hypothetical protein [Planctomycetaceae bacterium]
VGRYSKAGKVAINVEGKVGTETKTFSFDGELVEESKDQTSSFISRLWAIRRIGEILDQIDLKGQNKELVDELVALSTTYGILTPYTSFLADDSVALTDRSSNATTALSKTSALKTVTGGYAVEQRSSKLDFQNAQSLDSFNVKNTLNNSNVEREGRKLAGLARGRADSGSGGVARLGMPTSAPRSLSMSSAPLMKSADKVDAAGESSEVSAPELSVQTVNNRSFFKKAGVWVDSTLSETQMKAENMITVKQFSEDYFNLIAKHKEELTPYLTIGGSQIVNVNGQAYNFVP